MINYDSTLRVLIDMHLTHQLEIFIHDDSKILILGSFPSVKSREYGFYYSHKQNRFFPVLAKLFDEPVPSSIEERKQFLIKHKIALYDVVEECDIHSSEDASIKNVVPVDIISILKRYPNIKVIGITGKKAASLFDKYLLDKVNIPVIYLPSTSPTNAKMSVDDLVDEYKALLKI